MPVNTSCHIVSLAAGTAEYEEVQDKFQATCTQTIITVEYSQECFSHQVFCGDSNVTTNFTVFKIDRIQNPLLWKSLQVKKRNMEQKNGHQNNEKILFHGTSEDTLSIINENGFNRSYAGKNGEKF